VAYFVAIRVQNVNVNTSSQALWSSHNISHIAIGLRENLAATKLNIAVHSTLWRGTQRTDSQFIHKHCYTTRYKNTPANSKYKSI